MAAVFRQGENDEFWWPVTHKIPVDNGKHVAMSMQCKLKRYDQKKVDDLYDQMLAGDLNARDLVDDILVGWRNMKGVELADGSAPSFEDEDSREWVLGIAGTARSIVDAWISAQTTAGRRKN